MLRSLKCWQV